MPFPSITRIAELTFQLLSLEKLATKLASDGPVKTLKTPRKVSATLGGVYIIQTTNASFVWEHPFYPQFYVSLEELNEQSKNRSFTIEPIKNIKADDGKVIATRLRISVPDTEKSTDEVLAFNWELPGKAADISGLVKIDFAAMDQWFEEDTPIHVHPKDPFKRVDVLQSNRRITVSVAGHQIASTATAMHLYETGLPCRYYIPLTSIHQTVLRKSNTTTQCPYKGVAEYYSVDIGGKLHEDLFWYYRAPTLECAKIEGLCCPYNERVDIKLDGVELERPKTHFGKPKETGPPSAT